MKAGAPAQRVIAFFETLAPQSLAGIGDIYHANASFKDPFNAVQGSDAITRIFAHMFATTEAPRFTVLDVCGDDTHCFLSWDLRFRSKGRGARDWTIHGASRLVFDRDGRILSHRDYWDAAGEFYERLPLLGALLRRLRRHMQVDPA